MPRGISKLKREILKSVDPGGISAFATDVNSFPASALSSGSSRVVSLSASTDGGDSGNYIQEGWTKIGNKDVVHPGSFFER